MRVRDHLPAGLTLLLLSLRPTPDLGLNLSCPQGAPPPIFTARGLLEGLAGGLWVSDVSLTEDPTNQPTNQPSEQGVGRQSLRAARFPFFCVSLRIAAGASSPPATSRSHQAGLQVTFLEEAGL